MKIGIIYSTITNHSKKIANYLGQEFLITPQNIKKNPLIEETDILFIISGIYGGSSSKKLIKYVKTLDKNKIKNACLMTSSAGMDIYQDEVRKALEEQGINTLKDEFMCRGSFLFFHMSRPNNSDLENSVSFARKIVTKLSKK